jgi:hypothetical protein
MSTLFAWGLATGVATIIATLYLAARRISQADAAHATATRLRVRHGGRAAATVRNGFGKPIDPRDRDAAKRADVQGSSTWDPRSVDGLGLLVRAMKYLAQTDPVANRRALELLLQHVRTRFRITAPRRR